MTDARWVPESEAQVVRLCQEFVRIDSTPGREERLVSRIAEVMEELRFVDVRIDRAGNAVARLGPAGAPPMVLIDAHVDTVPVPSPAEWDYPPFGGVIADGRLWGVGTSDMKGGLAAAMTGLGRLVAQGWVPKHPVELVASVAEETVEGAALRSVLEDRPHPSAVVIAEPTSLRIANAQRGRAKVRVAITGRSGHAAFPERNINAVAYMAELIGTIANHVPADRHALLGSRSLSVLDIQSDPYPSMSTTPGSCVARFDCRLLPGDDIATVQRWFRDATSVWALAPEGPRVDVTIEAAAFATYTGYSLDYPEFSAPWETPVSSTVVTAARSALQKAGLTGELGHYTFCTNGSLTGGELSIPTIGFGPGDQAVAHGKNEFVEVAELESAAAGFSALARGLVDIGARSDSQ